MSNLMGETKVEAPISKYWNSKKTPAAKGDQVKGVVLRAEADTYKDKPTTRYVLLGDDGNEIVLPNHTVLNNTMKKVQVGKMVRIVYQGKGEAARGRSAPELYDVYMSDAPAKPGSAQAQPSSEITDPAGKLLAVLKTCPAGLMDKPFWDEVGKIVANIGEGMALVGKLKSEGRVVQENGTWRAT